MRLRSGRRLCSPPPPPPRGGRPRWRPASDDQDRLSGLPDELLLEVLARLGCAREAARTGVLSRRWRGLWPDLRALTFNFDDVSPDSAVSALTQVSSLLLAADRPAPLELVVTVRNGKEAYDIDIELPCFQRATSIQLDGTPIRGTGYPNLSLLRGIAPAADFARLEEPSLTCCFVDPGVLLARCPRLRKLQMVEVMVPDGSRTFTVESKSLEELILGLDVSCFRPRSVHHIVVVAPELSQFSFASFESGTLSMELSAPKLEESHLCYGYIYGGVRVGYGDEWKLGVFSVRTDWSSRHGQGCLPRVRVHILSLLVSFTQKRPAQRTIAQEIARLQVTDFSVLELQLIRSRGHVFGALVLHLLRMRTSIQRLDVDVEREDEECWENCDCDEQAGNWRHQQISLPQLEVVEFKSFRCHDHELDLLKLLFRSAPMLKRMGIQLSSDASLVGVAYQKLQSIFAANASVECSVQVYGVI